MSIDGGLRKEFHKRIKPCRWTAIETGGVSPGTPDSNYCLPGGIEGWIEFKLTDTSDNMRWSWQPGQFSWAKAQVSVGGRWLLGVRRRTALVDQLWMFTLRDVEQNGMPINKLNEMPTNNCYGFVRPSTWDWLRVIVLMREC